MSKIRELPPKERILELEKLKKEIEKEEKTAEVELKERIIKEIEETKPEERKKKKSDDGEEESPKKKKEESIEEIVASVHTSEIEKTAAVSYTPMQQQPTIEYAKKQEDLS